MSDPFERFDIERANPEHGVMNCVVIPEDMIPCVGDVMQAATNNDAFVDNSGKKTVDHKCCVRYPGHDQELLTFDEIVKRNKAIIVTRERVREITE